MIGHGYRVFGRHGPGSSAGPRSSDPIARFPPARQARPAVAASQRAPSGPSSREGLKMRTLTQLLPRLGIPLAVLAASAAGAGPGESPRRVLSLDGVWQIAEGTMDRPPAAFDRTVPVPGLVSLASPAFVPPPGPPVKDRGQVAQKDPARDAFWYRRTFALGQPVPEAALLKVRKAMYGAQVILNGVVLGYHAPSFTPGYFDAGAALR